MSEKQFDVKLTELLKENSDFVDDTGDLHRERIKDKAWNFDRELIDLLLKDDMIASHFFDEVSEGRFIFNNKRFIEYLNNMHFYAKSYTQFRNKIGLTIDNKYLRERGEVALAFPYKDCVLEGGQTKEDEKRNEVFFNELLAQDEITRMLDPKVLTNWKRHTSSGKQDVTEIKRDDKGIIRENLIIKGNNLIALSCLEKQFHQQVKLIYIDPPYNANTADDTFQYNDHFPRSTWLTFMKNRLGIAKKLLRNDGFILIQIDNRELAYLKCLCDDVFDGNFRNGIIVKKGQKNLQKQFNFIERLNAGYDTILLYSKESKIKLPNLYKKIGRARESSWNNHWRGTDRPTMRFELFGITPENGQWRWEKTRTYAAVENYHTLVTYIRSCGINDPEISDDNIDTYYHLYLQENSILSHKDFELVRLSKTGKPEHYIPATDHILLSENWTDISVAGNQTDFSHEKNEAILKRILEWLTEEGDIILDFFAGSGTTASVAHKLMRQWILIEQMDYVQTRTVTRLCNVVSGEQGGVSQNVKWQGGGDFISCELKSDNQTFLDRIQSATESETLLAIWREMCGGVSVLKWYLNTDNIEAAEKEFIGIEDVEQQKQALVDLLDKSHLYVHYSEMDDENAGVNEYDKQLTHSFYKGGDTDAES